MAKAPHACLRCYGLSTPVRLKPGSKWIEILLWTVFLIPGPFYTLWRNMAATWVCALCKSDNIIPADSPVGQKVIQQVRTSPFKK